jgi:hypothetical protein
MEYIINIQRKIENPNFEIELKAYNEANYYAGFNQKNKDFPERYFLEKTLDTVLTQEEWEQAKKSILQII